jgi:hypothetical protein
MEPQSPGHGAMQVAADKQSHCFSCQSCVALERQTGNGKNQYRFIRLGGFF